MVYRIVDTPYTKQVRKRVGTGRFRTIGSGRRARKEEIMKEVLVTENHTRREGVLSVSLRVVEVATGRILASRTVSHPEVRHGIGPAVHALFQGEAGDPASGGHAPRPCGGGVHPIFRVRLSPVRDHKTDPRVRGGRGGYGGQIRKAGSLKEAIRIWTEHVRTRPESNEALYNLGVAYEALGQFERARTAYRQAPSACDQRLVHQSTGRSGQTDSRTQ